MRTSKKIIALILSIVMVFSAVSISASAVKDINRRHNSFLSTLGYNMFNFASSLYEHTGLVWERFVSPVDLQKARVAVAVEAGDLIHVGGLNVRNVDPIYTATIASITAGRQALAYGLAVIGASLAGIRFGYEPEDSETGEIK